MTTIEPPAPSEGPNAMSRFERFLTLWVALCIVVGVGLGHLFPSAFQAIGSAEVAKVNLPVAVLIWLMIIPMLMKVDFGAMRQVGQHWRGIGVTLFVNWAVKPFAELKGSLPAGVEVVTTYDRSQLIDRAIANLTQKLVEEFIVVAIVCGLFLWHARSALVAILTLPLGVLAAFLVMRGQGVNANIMSLGGIAIAIGAMVDAAVVMIENAHKHLER
jgi:hypothetical protein